MEAEAGLPVKELYRRHGFSEASYYLWRSTFGGMSVSDAKRLKVLERLLKDDIKSRFATNVVQSAKFPNCCKPR